MCILLMKKWFFTWIVWRQGEAMKTTYGAYSALRNIFNAWGSTSSIAIFPSEWIERIVSSFVPYIESSWVPEKNISYKFYTNGGLHE